MLQTKIIKDSSNSEVHLRIFEEIEGGFLLVVESSTLLTTRLSWGLAIGQRNTIQITMVVSIMVAKVNAE